MDIEKKTFFFFLKREERSLRKYSINFDFSIIFMCRVTNLFRIDYKNLIVYHKNLQFTVKCYLISFTIL